MPIPQILIISVVQLEDLSLLYVGLYACLVVNTTLSDMVIGLSVLYVKVVVSDAALVYAFSYQCHVALIRFMSRV